jgi:hypothetical protein
MNKNDFIIYLANLESTDLDPNFLLQVNAKKVGDRKLKTCKK